MFLSISSILRAFFFLAQCSSAQVSPPLSSLPPSDVTRSDVIFSELKTTIISGAQTAPTASSAPSSTTTEAFTAIATLSSNGIHGTASAITAVRSRPPTTRPCNGYPEFCERKFSNISMVVAHNSPFVKPHNVASNQLYTVVDQLNDGIRGLQFETQKPNTSSEIRLCHSSCEYLDVGTLESYLTTVRGWLDAHPYEVIAIIMGNNNGQRTHIAASEFIAPFKRAGMTRYLWTPPAPTMNLTEWPTLAEMILKDKRVVVMLDYGANQTEAPWLLRQFNYQWETPFSPINPAFPCTQQRPPNQTEDVSRNRMYTLNHNLNIELSLTGVSGLLVPASALLDKVNAVSGNGSLGLNVEHCEQLWGRPPNFMLVDYYNRGNFAGSVFQVAAIANNVTYNHKTYCGPDSNSAASRMSQGSTVLFSCCIVLFLFLGRDLGIFTGGFLLFASR
ncbi:PLC-like phosphodiesterase [Ophiobolus disseminans]|uniref:PLC-like phosphodiesterase n=1 Tax=Ophiobolus disseminans TaxID=1469910 RepID=A0A6A7ADV3_9PLEO|nr:PLC-like phosphodiesterase [Ophiobolus disseminans]